MNMDEFLALISYCNSDVFYPHIFLTFLVSTRAKVTQWKDELGTCRYFPTSSKPKLPAAPAPLNRLHLEDGTTTRWKTYDDFQGPSNEICLCYISLHKPIVIPNFSIHKIITTGKSQNFITSMCKILLKNKRDIINIKNMYIISKLIDILYIYNI